MRTEILRLARSSLVYGVGQVLLRVISLLLLPVFTSYLTPSDYGVSSVLSVATFFLSSVFALGIPAAIGLVYFGETDRNARDATIWTATAVVGVSALTLVALSILGGSEVAHVLFPDGSAAYDYPRLVEIAVTTAAAGIATQPLLIYLQLEQRAKVFVALTVTSSLVTIFLSVLLVAGLRQGVTGLLVASLIGQAITFLLALAPAIRRVAFGLRSRLAGALLRLGVPLIPSFFFLFLMLQVNRYILQIDRGLGEVGIYTIGFNLGYVISLAVSGFTSAWYPFFMSYVDRQDEARRLFGRITTYYVLGFGSVALLFFLGARPVVLLLTRAPFHEASVVVGLSATAQYLLGLHSILQAGMYFAKEVKFIAVVLGIAAAAALLLNVALIPVLGIAGAALALAAGSGVTAAAQYVWNVRRHYLGVEYERSRLGAFAVAFVALAVASVWPRELPLIAEVLLSCVGAAALVVVVYRLLTPEERQLVIETPGRWLRSRSTAAVS